jgi:hypothetical protein
MLESPEATTNLEPSSSSQLSAAKSFSSSNGKTHPRSLSGAAAF